MKDRLFKELTAHYGDLQKAGAEGLRRLNATPYDGKYEIRHLQRAAILNAFAYTLPDKLGSFEKVKKNYARDRLVYFSHELNAELIWRRRRGIGYNCRKKRKERYEQLALFAEQGIPFRDEMHRQIALVWDLPKLDENHIATEAFPFAVKIAKPGYKIDECEWESGFSLVEISEVFPTTAEIDPDAPDWDIESDNEAQES
ncbi:Hypothetical protein Cul210931_0177 [Corynebacterium ulcerans]|nr:hypothetical protein [Corynebacterium ulcerans]AIU29546.1 Hypothetical protein Cul210931_0177 [Corynebacterium ulcerans]AIU90781.1 Hypothetical protein Cul05146_0185 [Corynebacterium ulcerans]NOL61902.1 hypothetical protein [Corynebacterium ulcerans]NON16772.1 hypothetical protein [Corynebacterium ulcerans]